MVTLEPGESVLRSGSVVWVGPPGPRPGTLTLTNHALVFEGPIPRPMRPGAAMRAQLPPVPGELRIALWRCRGAANVNSPQGPVLEVELLHRSLFFRIEAIDAWVQEIGRARAGAPPPPPWALKPEGAPTVRGRTAMPRCDYCGHLNAPTATKCESCGAPF
jgi:hypothetical protein